MMLKAIENKSIVLKKVKKNNIKMTLIFFIQLYCLEPYFSYNAEIIIILCFCIILFAIIPMLEKCYLKH